MENCRLELDTEKKAKKERAQKQRGGEYGEEKNKSKYEGDDKLLEKLLKKKRSRKVKPRHGKEQKVRYSFKCLKNYE